MKFNHWLVQKRNNPVYFMLIGICRKFQIITIQINTRTWIPLFSANCTGHMDNHSKIITPNQNTKMFFFLKHSPLPHCNDHCNKLYLKTKQNWKEKIKRKFSRRPSLKLSHQIVTHKHDSNPEVKNLDLVALRNPLPLT